MDFPIVTVVSIREVAIDHATLDAYITSETTAEPAFRRRIKFLDLLVTSARAQRLAFADVSRHWQCLGGSGGRLEPLFKPVLEVIDSVLRKDERYAFVQRYLVGATYDEIAQTSRPKLSGRAQAHKLVERARKKLEARIGKRIPNPFC